MGTAHYGSGTDRTITPGDWYFRFNPSGDPTGATVTHVAYRMLIAYNGGAKVDLGDVDIYLYSPNGERHTIYYNFDGFGSDTDDHNDSDSANDYDIYFDGSGGESTFSSGFDGNGVNGTWTLRVDNDTGKNLTMYYFDTWVDYVTGPDLIVDDIEFSGDLEVGEKVKITATLKNIGETDFGGLLEGFDIEYWVNGTRVGTDKVSFGLGAGKTNEESFSYRVTKAGQQDVEVRIVGTSGETSTSNNSKTADFFAKSADLIVQDIKIFGEAKVGREVEIEATLANVGEADYGGLLSGGFDLVYEVYNSTAGKFVNIGSDAVSFGLTKGQTNKESIDYTLKSGDTGQFRVRIVGTENETSTANNSRTERVAVDHDETHTVADSLDKIQTAMWFARSVYGDEDMGAGFRGVQDNGYDDAYDDYFAQYGWDVLTGADLGGHFVTQSENRFQPGGLYEGSAELFGLDTTWDAQSILAVNTDETGFKTLTLAFRGTDEADSAGPAFLNGQAFTGDGNYKHYNAHKSLVEAAISYANDASIGVDRFIVTGHSLGGSMADIFAAVDGQRVREEVDLAVVSFASAGVDKTLYSHTDLFNGFEHEVDHDVVDVDGSKVELTTPDWYIGISHNEDAVTFAETVDLDTIDGYVGNNVLRNNINFDSGIVKFHLPNLDNSEKGTNAWFSKGFGVHHDVGLYWAHVSWLVADPLAEFYDNSQKISFGLTNYNQVLDVNDAYFEVFQSYTGLDVAHYDGDRGDRALQGNGGDDFILGLSGDDTINGKGGDDLLSGGIAKDWLYGGDGADRIDGGEDNDWIEGGRGRDALEGGTGDDRINGNGGADELSGGDGNDKMYAGAGQDDIQGGNGKDRIFAGRGADVIESGAGKDIISGGKGADVFVFNTASQTDRITDFEARDRLSFGEEIADTLLSAEDFIDTYAKVIKAGVVFNFDEARVVLEGLSTTDGLDSSLILSVA